ncbi:hypothetical protein [Bradyrhizobium sp. ARR65]|uniref:hypothetical protein n=1 Tax=Bradyrhizobium sp. ARR65 TaxID=1040989 RepID=UPI00054CE4BD|nr:hypothetical protein [Bradyrhizobium sp. ARR65]
MIPHPEDVVLINAAAEAAKAAIAAGHPWERLNTVSQVYKATYIVRKLSDWLRRAHKNPIAGRLGDNTVEEDLATFRRIHGTRSHFVALRMLRRHAGVLGPRDRAPCRPARRGPYPEDAALIDAAAEAARANIDAEKPWLFVGTRKRVNQAVKSLNRFSGWLKRTSRRAIAGRLNDVSLKEDITAFYKSKPRLSVDSGVRMLQEHARDLEEFALDLEQQLEVDGAPSAAGESSYQHSSLAPLFTQLFGETPPSESPPSSPGLRGGGSDSNDAMSPITRDAVAREDFGHVIDLGWDHGPQPAPDILIGALNRRRSLPTPLHPMTNFYIRGQPYTALLGRGLREVSPNNPLGVNIILIPRLKGG